MDELSKVYTNDNGHSIYVSGYEAIVDAVRNDTLSIYNIKSILSLGTENRLPFDKLSDYGIDFYNCLSVTDYATHEDREHLKSQFPHTRMFIDIGLYNGSVLVHCRAGVYRSATVVIDYIQYLAKISLEEVIVMVKQSRPRITSSFYDHYYPRDHQNGCNHYKGSWSN